MAHYLFQIIPTSVVLTIGYGSSIIIIRDLLFPRSQLVANHSILMTSSYLWYLQ